MTLIELAAVIVLVALLGTLFAKRFDLVAPLKAKSELRNLAATIETVAASARDTDTVLRLVINRERNSFFVRSELPPDSTTNSLSKRQSSSKLSSFKTKGEIARQQAADYDNVLSLDEQLAQQERREGGGLEQLFFDQLLQDNSDGTLLGVPTELPSLAKEQFISPDFSLAPIRGIDTEDDSKLSVIRFVGRRYAPSFKIIAAQGQGQNVLSFEALSGKVYFTEDLPIGEDVPDVSKFR